MQILSNFIDGAQVKTERQTISFSGATSELLYAKSNFMDVVAAVQSANKAAKKWQERSFIERIHLLKNFVKLLEDNLAVFVDFESCDIGLTTESAKKLCSEALENFKSCLSFAQNVENTKAAGDQYQIQTPVGVVGLVTDRHRSFSTILENLAVSLACGNLIILHPSAYGMRSALRLAEVAIEAQIPIGVFNVLLGDSAELAVQICEHPGIKYIRFYGSNSLGEKIAKVAAENQKRLASYLGVNNAAVVFADADLKDCVASILNLAFDFNYYGRRRVNRVLVQEKFSSEFKNELDSQLPQFTKLVGILPDELKKQMSGYLEQSKKDKAKVHPVSDKQIQIYDDLTNCSTLHQEDLVGPILFIQSFKYVVDLPKILAAGPYASSTYIWTHDISRIHKVSQLVESSKIYFNPKNISLEIFASTNLKSSGFGEDGIEGIYNFNLNRKIIKT